MCAESFRVKNVIHVYAFFFWFVCDADRIAIFLHGIDSWMHRNFLFFCSALFFLCDNFVFIVLCRDDVNVVYTVRYSIYIIIFFLFLYFPFLSLLGLCSSCVEHVFNRCSSFSFSPSVLSWYNSRKWLLFNHFFAKFLICQHAFWIDFSVICEHKYIICFEYVQHAFNKCSSCVEHLFITCSIHTKILFHLLFCDHSVVLLVHDLDQYSIHSQSSKSCITKNRDKFRVAVCGRIVWEIERFFHWFFVQW